MFENQIDYLTQRIRALQEEVANKEQQIDTLTNYLFEVTDKDCMQDYRDIVRKEISKP